MILGHGGLELRARAYIAEAKCYLSNPSFSGTLVFSDGIDWTFFKSAFFLSSLLVLFLLLQC